MCCRCTVLTAPPLFRSFFCSSPGLLSTTASRAVVVARRICIEKVEKSPGGVVVLTSIYKERNSFSKGAHRATLPVSSSPPINPPSLLHVLNNIFPPSPLSHPTTPVTTLTRFNKEQPSPCGGSLVFISYHVEFSLNFYLVPSPFFIF